MEKVQSIGIMEHHLMDFLLMGRKMEKDYLDGAMDPTMRVNSRMTYFMDMANTFGQMASLIKEIGLRGIWMAKVP